MKTLNSLTGNPFAVFYDPDDGGGGSSDDKTFTQSEVNAMIAKRLSRDMPKKKDEHVSEFLAELGVDKDTLSELIKNNTPEKDLEIKKLTTELKRLKKDFESTTTERDSLNQRLTETTKRSEIMKLIGSKCDDKQKSVAYRELSTQFDLVDGALAHKDGSKPDEFVEKFLTDNPFLRAAKAPTDNVPPKTGVSGEKKNPKHQVPYENDGGRRARLMSKLGS